MPFDPELDAALKCLNHEEISMTSSQRRRILNSFGNLIDSSNERSTSTISSNYSSYDTESQSDSTSSLISGSQSSTELEDEETKTKKKINQSPPPVTAPPSPTVRDKSVAEKLILQFKAANTIAEQKTLLKSLQQKAGKSFKELSYTQKDGKEVWVWCDPTKDSNDPDYHITYTRPANGKLEITAGSKASAYLCFEPDEKQGLSGAIVDIEGKTVTIHTPDEKNCVLPCETKIMGPHTQRLKEKTASPPAPGLLSR